MAEEPETNQPDLVQRLEADLEEAKATIEAVPAKIEAAVDAKLAAIHVHLDALKEDIRANVSNEVPTTAHNKIMAFVEDARAKIASLF